MRKIVCLGLVLLAGVLFAVPAWADEEVEAVESGESSTEYTGVREKSFGARIAPYAPLRGGVDFLWRPKWGVGVLQAESLRHWEHFKEGELYLDGVNVNIGIGIWTNMEKTNWLGGHIYFGLSLPVVSGKKMGFASRLIIGQGKFFGVGMDVYPRLWRGGRVNKGDKFFSYFWDAKTISRNIILTRDGKKSDLYHSSLLKNVVAEAGVRYWF